MFARSRGHRRRFVFTAQDTVRGGRERRKYGVNRSESKILFGVVAEVQVRAVNRG